jgi:uncharacterized membrane protein YgdD (TMEM256/DUF423 family)
MATIAIRIHSLAQLFDSLDPAPFREKALDTKAEEYLLSCARELHHREGIEVLIHAPGALRASSADVEAALHAHFGLALEAADRRDRQRMRVGRATLVLGLAVLAVCLGLRQLLGIDGLAWRAALGEGLLILGWVALWRPVEILLFERWESRHERQSLSKLARAPVRFAFSD